MNYSEVSALSATELRKRINETRSEMFEAQMKNSLGQLANPMTIRAARKTIAQLQTALSAAAAVAAPKAKKTRGQK